MKCRVTSNLKTWPETITIIPTVVINRMMLWSANHSLQSCSLRNLQHDGLHSSVKTCPRDSCRPVQHTVSFRQSRHICNVCKPSTQAGEVQLAAVPLARLQPECSVLSMNASSLAMGASLLYLTSVPNSFAAESNADDHNDNNKNETMEEQSKPKRRQRLKAKDLARILNIPDDAAGLLMERVQDLKSHPALRIQASLTRMTHVLQVDIKTASGLALKQPRMLLVPPDQLTNRIADLATLLQVPQNEAVQLVLQQPGLIVHQHETLRARLAALVTLIREALAQDASAAEGKGRNEGAPAIAKPSVCAVNMCRREPGLLTVTHTQLASKITALSAALGSTASLIPGLQLAAQAPTSILLPPSRTASIVATVATLLQISTRAAGDLLIRQPRLLTQSGEALSTNLRGLASGLGVERVAAAVMCAENPSLLLLTPQDVPMRLKALASSLAVSQDRALQLASTKPGLLLKDPQAVSAALNAARKRGDLPPR